MRSPQSGAETPTAAAGHPPVTFSGFSEPVPDLYEFHTSDGRHVCLHDMDCVGILFEPTSRRLALTFECIESDLMDSLTVVLTFEDARFYEWRDDAADEAELALADNPTRVRGQVGSHGQIGETAFHLQLLDLYMAFNARSVRCDVVPDTPSQDSSGT